MCELVLELACEVTVRHRPDIPAPWALLYFEPRNHIETCLFLSTRYADFVFGASISGYRPMSVENPSKSEAHKVLTFVVHWITFQINVVQFEVED